MAGKLLVPVAITDDTDLSATFTFKVKDVSYAFGDDGGACACCERQMAPVDTFVRCTAVPSGTRLTICMECWRKFNG